ncbi:MAG: hypothetical protein Q9M92_08940 [Enterobacterales bacterium]|nr:hypothetical protein [Enterobacterales bacterium]
MKNLLMFSIIFIVSCSVGAINKMNKSDLREALVSSLHDMDYLRSSKGSKLYDIELVSSESIDNYSFYKFTSFEPLFNEHDFIFAKETNSEKIILLTESLKNFNALLINEASNEEQAITVAREFLYLTRPFYKLFVLIDNQEKVKEWLNDSIQFDLQPSQIEMRKSKKGFVGEVYVLIGKQLIKREIAIHGANVSFNDTLLDDDAGKFLNPHY